MVTKSDEGDEWNINEGTSGKRQHSGTNKGQFDRSHVDSHYFKYFTNTMVFVQLLVDLLLAR